MSSATPQPAGLAHNPLDVLDHVHRMQAQLCDALELIADGLPDDIDRRLCAHVAMELQYDLPLHHRDEEDGLFPLLRRHATPEDDMDSVLDRLESEHEADLGFAGEISETLELLGRGSPPANPEMVGYMLRGFFQCYRRHIHWENALVMPLARRRLTADELAELSACMVQNRELAREDAARSGRNAQRKP